MNSAGALLLRDAVEDASGLVLRRGWRVSRSGHGTLLLGRFQLEASKEPGVDSYPKSPTSEGPPLASEAVQRNVPSSL